MNKQDCGDHKIHQSENQVTTNNHSNPHFPTPAEEPWSYWNTNALGKREKQKFYMKVISMGRENILMTQQRETRLRGLE